MRYMIIGLMVLSLVLTGPALAEKSPFSAPDEDELQTATDQAVSTAGQAVEQVDIKELEAANDLPPVPAAVDKPSGQAQSDEGDSGTGGQVVAGGSGGGSGSDDQTRALDKIDDQGDTRADAQADAQGQAVDSAASSGSMVSGSAPQTVSAPVGVSQVSSPEEGGRALSLNGAGDFMEIAHSESLDITTEITMEAWIKPKAFDRGIQSIVCKSSNLENNGYIFPRFDNGPNLVFYVRTRNWQILNVGPVIPAGEWRHVAASYDGQKMAIYVDGVLQKKPMSVQGLISRNSNSLVIGNQPGYHEYYNGVIDEVRIWSRALTQAEIQATMNIGLSGDEPDLAAYYTFDGLDENNRIADLSGNGNHGVLKAKAQLIASTAPIGRPVGGAVAASGQDQIQGSDTGPAVVEPSAAVRLKRLKGFGDFTGRGEVLKRDGSSDAHLNLKITAPDRTITGLVLRTISDQKPVWDTNPNNGVWLVAVTRQGKTLSNQDGTVNLPLGPDEEKLDLWVQDNHTLARGKDRLELVVSFEDGREMVLEVAGK